MKASELIAKLQKLIDSEGDKEMAVAGVFSGGVHQSVDVFSPAEYYKPYDPDVGCGFLGDASDVQDCFIIDEGDM